MPDRLKVTVSDAITGEVLGENVIYDDYVLVCAGQPYLAHTSAYANGTHVLTVKDCGKPPSVIRSNGPVAHSAQEDT